MGRIAGAEQATLSFVLRMAKENQFEKVLAVQPVVTLLSRSLLDPAGATFMLLGLKKAETEAAVLERLQSSGLVGALLRAVTEVDVPPLWERVAVKAFLGESPEPKSASPVSFLLVKCLTQLHQVAPLQPDLAVWTALLEFVSGSDVDLAAASASLIRSFTLGSEANEDMLVQAKGIGLLAELAMRSPDLTDDILELLSDVCKGTTIANPVEPPVIPWLVDRLRSPELEGKAKQSVILVLIYFARIERYKSRVVQSGGFDFLSELIRMVRSEDVEILRRIAKSDVELIKEIGSGACSRVWRGKWDGKQVAVKMFNESYSAFSEKEFGSELAIMSVLRHPNICHALGGGTIPGERFLVMPLFRRGSLLDVVRNKDITLSMYRILNICVDSAVGMAFLHEAGILHRDLKTGNLLVDDNWRIAVVDFGISRMIDLSMSRKNIGTPIYSAPEILFGKPYSFSADVYSFAFVIWELLAREVPYKKHAQPYIINGVCNDGLRPPQPKDCPKVLWKLIERCWAQEAEDRPTFPEIVSILKRLQGNVGALHGLKSTSSKLTMEMAKTLRNSAKPVEEKLPETEWGKLSKESRQSRDSNNNSNNE
jgi:thiamine kinase-like enzyme